MLWRCYYDITNTEVDPEYPITIFKVQTLGTLLFSKSFGVALTTNMKRIPKWFFFVEQQTVYLITVKVSDRFHEIYLCDNWLTNAGSQQMLRTAMVTNFVLRKIIWESHLWYTDIVLQYLATFIMVEYVNDSYLFVS